MTRKKILSEIERMTGDEKLEVIEVTTRLLREDFKPPHKSRFSPEFERQIEKAALIMRDEYTAGGELTALSAR
ncbi:hypothetical protein FJY63_03540 [Candidatus Sumerlaeota bacterium]|nr:hypothetical protein [Candidatus Sumerlaeota bacterium]